MLRAIPPRISGGSRSQNRNICLFNRLEVRSCARRSRRARIET